MALVEVRNLKKYFPIRGGLLSRIVGQVKAVDGAYPLFGTLALEDGGSLAAALAERDGLLHLLADLGDEVSSGQPIAQIWPPDRTGVAPVEIRANRDGILVARHFPGLVQSGDCLAVIACKK